MAPFAPWWQVAAAAAARAARLPLGYWNDLCSDWGGTAKHPSWETGVGRGKELQTRGGSWWLKLKQGPAERIFHPWILTAHHTCTGHVPVWAAKRVYLTGQRVSDQRGQLPRARKTRAADGSALCQNPPLQEEQMDKRCRLGFQRCCMSLSDFWLTCPLPVLTDSPSLGRIPRTV